MSDTDEIEKASAQIAKSVVMLERLMQRYCPPQVAADAVALLHSVCASCEARGRYMGGKEVKNMVDEVFRDAHAPTVTS